MKLYEEFKEYEDLWGEPLKESYIKNFEGKDYDLTRERDLKKLINAILQKELGIKIPLDIAKMKIINRLMSQLKHEGADRKIIDMLEDMQIEGV